MGPAWRHSPSGLDAGLGSESHATGSRTDGTNVITKPLCRAGYLFLMCSIFQQTACYFFSVNTTHKLHKCINAISGACNTGLASQIYLDIVTLEETPHLFRSFVSFFHLSVCCRTVTLKVILSVLSLTD